MNQTTGMEYSERGVESDTDIAGEEVSNIRTKIPDVVVL
jgi:hypothetical protein